MNSPSHKLRDAFVVTAFGFLAFFAVRLSGQPSVDQSYIHRSQASERYRHLFRPIGDRLEIAGKERLVLTANLVQPARNGSSLSVQVTIDVAGQLRIDFASAASGPSVVFDGDSVARAGGPPGKADQDLADSLIGDSVEYFLRGHVRGNAIRQIASQAVLGNPRDSSTPSGRFDGYQVIEHRRNATKTQDHSKVYWFNSDTHLLRSVFSQGDSPGPASQIETRFSDWRPVSGQMIPALVERFENGIMTLSLTVQSVTIANRKADGIFGHP